MRLKQVSVAAVGEYQDRVQVGLDAKQASLGHSVWSTKELVRNAESQPLSPKQNKLFNKVPSDLKVH